MSRPPLRVLNPFLTKDRLSQFGFFIITALSVICNISFYVIIIAYFSEQEVQEKEQTTFAPRTDGESDGDGASSYANETRSDNLSPSPFLFNSTFNAINSTIREPTNVDLFIPVGISFLLVVYRLILDYSLKERLLKGLERPAAWVCVFYLLTWPISKAHLVWRWSLKYRIDLLVSTRPFPIAWTEWRKSRWELYSIFFNEAIFECFPVVLFTLAHQCLRPDPIFFGGLPIDLNRFCFIVHFLFLCSLSSCVVDGQLRGRKKFDAVLRQVLMIGFWMLAVTGTVSIVAWFVTLNQNFVTYWWFLYYFSPSDPSYPRTLEAIYYYRGVVLYYLMLPAVVLLHVSMILYFYKNRWSNDRPISRLAKVVCTSIFMPASICVMVVVLPELDILCCAIVPFYFLLLNGDKSSTECSAKEMFEAKLVQSLAELLDRSGNANFAHQPAEIQKTTEFRLWTITPPRLLFSPPLSLEEDYQFRANVINDWLLDKNFSRTNHHADLATEIRQKMSEEKKQWKELRDRNANGFGDKRDPSSDRSEKQQFLAQTTTSTLTNNLHQVSFFRLLNGYSPRGMIQSARSHFRATLRRNDIPWAQRWLLLYTTFVLGPVFGILNALFLSIWPIVVWWNNETKNRIQEIGTEFWCFPVALTLTHCFVLLLVLIGTVLYIYRLWRSSYAVVLQFKLAIVISFQECEGKLYSLYLSHLAREGLNSTPLKLRLASSSSSAHTLAPALPAVLIELVLEYLPVAEAWHPPFDPCFSSAGSWQACLTFPRIRASQHERRPLITSSAQIGNRENVSCTHADHCFQLSRFDPNFSHPSPSCSHTLREQRIRDVLKMSAPLPQQQICESDRKETETILQVEEHES